MLCWRYINLQSGLQSVLSCKFRLSNPLHFNDPFDSAGITIRNLNDEVKQWYGNEQRISDAERSGIVSMMRFLCLSKDEGLTEDGDVLLWSHYADSGRGIRIGLKVDGLGYELREVQYLPDRPCFDLKGISVDKVHKVLSQQMIDVYSRKGTAWNYENELRICVMLNVVSPRVEVSDLGDAFCLFPPNHIIHVDFGAKMSLEECISAALTILQREELEHVQFRRVIVDRSSFRYNYEPLDIHRCMLRSKSNGLKTKSPLSNQ